jgi:hypothetical protein
MNTDRLIILSMGLGRDSITMLCLLIEGKLLVDGEPVGPSAVDAVVFSDPGSEWEHSYAMIPRVRALCEAHGLRFIILSKPEARGAGGWREYIKAGVFLPSAATPWQRLLKGRSIDEKAAGGYYHRRAPILHDYLRGAQITLRANPACTVNHKILPINSRLVNDLCLERFGVNTNRGAWGRKVKAGEMRKHRILIGIAADEIRRVQRGVEAAARKANAYYESSYPLAEAGITKADEGPILARHGLDDTRKSGCDHCHFQPDSWFFALRETNPERFAQVVEYEATCNRVRDERGEPNRYLRGSKPIDQVVESWRRRNPDPTVEEILDKGYDRPGCKAPEKGAA